jgi:hypothetical protein
MAPPNSFTFFKSCADSTVTSSSRSCCPITYVSQIEIPPSKFNVIGNFVFSRETFFFPVKL